MEKILVVMDARNPATNVLDFACYIASVTQSRLTGVFLENTLRSHPYASASGAEEKMTDPASDAEYQKLACEKNIDFFHAACEKREVLHNVHRDRGIPGKEIIEESRFADLIILDPRTSLNGKYEGAPTKFVRWIMEGAECPVLTAPENFAGIDEIIFSYDGSRSCVFAIKNFTHLFPQFRSKHTTILQINSENSVTITEKYKLKEWLKNHYVNTEIQLLQGDARYELFNFLLHRENVLLVMGAYGRNILSQSFRASHADLLIKMADVPIFITHY